MEQSSSEVKSHPHAQKFSAFYTIQGFVTEFKSCCQWTRNLSQKNPANTLLWNPLSAMLFEVVVSFHVFRLQC
jgi:hypothetical protein